MYFASMKLHVTTSVKFASKDWLFGIYENRERSKNMFREITLGCMGGIHSLTLTISFLKGIALGMKPYGGLSLLYFMLSW